MLLSESEPGSAAPCLPFRKLPTDSENRHSVDDATCRIASSIASHARRRPVRSGGLDHWWVRLGVGLQSARGREGR
eukprot:3017332-Rhodomonas_salina.3